MFRTRPTEHNKKDDRSKEELTANIVVFVVACALIRFIPILVRKIAS